MRQIFTCTDYSIGHEYIQVPNFIEICCIVLEMSRFSCYAFILCTSMNNIKILISAQNSPTTRTYRYKLSTVLLALTVNSIVIIIRIIRYNIKKLCILSIVYLRIMYLRIKKTISLKTLTFGLCNRDVFFL
jgi:hypothetical protein